MKKIVFLIFFLACFVRLLYFPDNVYFGYDQARDAFEAQNIYKNLDFKIIGPSTASEGLFHGPLYWYLIGPFYLLGGGNPEFSAAFLLFLNAAGVFIIYWIGKTLFNKNVGLAACLIYAFSFGQTQYAMYFGNPGPAVLTTMLFWGGFAWVILKKDWRGIPLAFFCLGLSIQFEFFLVYLVPVTVVIISIFRKEILPKLSPKRRLITLLALCLSVSTFILSEAKFGFRSIKLLLDMAASAGGYRVEKNPATVYLQNLATEVQDNIANVTQIKFTLLVILGISLILLFRKNSQKQVTLLLLWIFSSVLIYLFGIPNLYYSNIGISAGIIILSTYLVCLVGKKVLVLGAAILVLILASNLNLIKNQNPKGIISSIYVQEGMLLYREKQALDYIYQEAQNKPIVVSGLTMPLKINTTWAYLFNWYGKEKYGYLPYWAGEVAGGYPGELPAWKSQEKEYAYFSIIEPVRGVRGAFVQQFLDEQEQYGKVTQEKVFGEKEQTQLIIQKRFK